MNWLTQSRFRTSLAVLGFLFVPLILAYLAAFFWIRHVSSGFFAPDQTIARAILLTGVAVSIGGTILTMIFAWKADRTIQPAAPTLSSPSPENSL